MPKTASTWHHKRQRLRQMRRQAQNGGPFAQSLAHQTQAALRQIAHTAMQQFGGPRRRSRGKVTRFHQRHAAAFERSLQRHAQARGATADDQEVPDGVFG